MMSLYVCLLLLLEVVRGTVSLKCYSCNDIDNIDKCQRITTCGIKQSCFTRTKDVGGNITYSMGCTVNKNCGSIPAYVKMSGERTIEKCNECCGNDKCNNRLCKYPKPVPCKDDSEIDCPYWNKNFNICESVHQAKRICREFCNLCALVDGNWTGWSHWSECDVTCGHGKHTRYRRCTNPAPAYQGLDCEGSSSDTKPCVRQLCPVHGGWTDWSNWGMCPVSCGIGIQKRYRKCTDPYPLRYGDHCFGDSIDVKLCKGKPCHVADGGWTEWGDWSSCSSICNTGLRKRSRSCSNPRPDPYGKPCDGDLTQVELCNKQTCHETSGSVAFNAYEVTDCSPAKGQTMIFSKTLTNIGDAYNSSTGVFTATKTGTYSFNAQLCIYGGKNMHFDIKVGSVAYATVYGYGDSHADCRLAQATVQLKRNDIVFVQWNTWWYGSSTNVVAQNNNYYRNYFSGSIFHL